MLQFGMPTLIENRTLEDCAALCSELGLDFVELNMNLPQYQLDAVDVSHFRSIAKKHGIFYTIHLDENLNVSDFNPYVAQAYMRTAAETIALAKELGAPVLNMHLSGGVYFTLPDRKVYLFDVYCDRYLDSIRAFRDMCTREIGSSGIMICIENSSGYTDIQKRAIELLLESEVFALTLDIGHNHGSGGKDELFIRSRADRLAHMHMHDAAGKRDHLVLGEGELDIAGYLELAREHSCRVVLETKTIDGLRRSVEWLRSRI